MTGGWQPYLFFRTPLNQIDAVFRRPMPHIPGWVHPLEEEKVKAGEWVDLAKPFNSDE